MTGACLAMQSLLPQGDALQLRALSVVVPLSAGVTAYLAAAALLKLREPWDLLRREAGASPANEQDM
jgi:hypothetical protein